MKLSPKQIRIRNFDNKYKPYHTILEGAVRSGKTFINNCLYFVHVAEHASKRRDFIITGHSIGSIERNVLKPLYDAFGCNVNLDKNNAFLLNGNKVHCFGCSDVDDYKKITGMTSYGWLANEATLHNRYAIQECFNRCSGEGARIFWDTNPDYPEHFIKTDYIDKSGSKLDSGRVRLHSWHFELEDNIFLSREYIEMLKASTPAGMFYDRKIKGLWVAAEGVVYEEFNRNTHVIEPIKPPPEWKRYRSIDYGYENPFVCLWICINPDGQIVIYDEHYESHMLIGEHARVIKAKTESFYDKDGRPVKPVSYETVADHDAQDNAEMRNLGIYTINAKKDVILGIEKVAERLKVKPNGRPGLLITSNCVNLLREFGSYSWNDRKDGRPVKEEPKKINDHAMDAVRYVVMHIDGKSQVRAGGIGLSRLGL